MDKRTVKETINPNLDVIQPFYTNLRMLVENSGVSAYTLSTKLGLDKMSLPKLIRGGSDPKLSTVVRIAKGMQVSLDALLNISNCEATVTSLVSSKPDTPPDTPPETVVSSVAMDTNKKQKIEFMKRVVEMRKRDSELLEAIGNLLAENRSRAVEKLVLARTNSDSDDSFDYLRIFDLLESSDMEFSNDEGDIGDDSESEDVCDQHDEFDEDDEYEDEGDLECD